MLWQLVAIRMASTCSMSCSYLMVSSSCLLYLGNPSGVNSCAVKFALVHLRGSSYGCYLLADSYFVVVVVVVVHCLLKKKNLTSKFCNTITKL